MEKEEREKRSDNLIIIGLEESEGKENEFKEEEVKKAKNLLSKVVGEEIEVIETHRLGQKNIGNRPRMLKEKLKDGSQRGNIVRVAYKVNEGVSQDKKVYVNKDLTPPEREKEKDLRKQLKDKREETGDRSWVIRGDKIIQKKQPAQGRDQARGGAN